MARPKIPAKNSKGNGNGNRMHLNGLSNGDLLSLKRNSIRNGG